MYTPPGTPRSRSFTRFTMRVGLEHFGQSVLLVVSIIFLRSAVLAILAIVVLLISGSRHSKARGVLLNFAEIHLICAGICERKLEERACPDFTRPAPLIGSPNHGNRHEGGPVISVTEPGSGASYVQISSRVCWP